MLALSTAAARPAAIRGHQAAIRSFRRASNCALPRMPVAAAPGEGGSSSGEADVAVFRFTLGNDTADALVPRVVGALGAAALLVNHLLGAQPPSEAQLRAEALGAVLAAVAFATPTIEERLKELQPGQGRKAAASTVAGATSVFALPADMKDATKQELAWSSYALLLNTNICGLAVFWDGQAVLARGLLGTAALGGAASGGKGTAEAALAGLSTLEPAAVSKGWQQGPLYCPDRAAISNAGAPGWPCVPSGAESLLVQPLAPFGGEQTSGSSSSAAPRGVLLLVSERPRALSGKERAWAAAIAAKLHAALAGGDA